jgi:hypothetical protein
LHDPNTPYTASSIESEAEVDMARRSLAVLGTLAVAGALASCGGGGESASPTAASPAARVATSHNAGQDCLRCHREFAAAGTVYGSGGAALAGAAVRLTTAADGGGTVLATLTSDGSGNFYTTRSLDLAAGVFADVTGPGGARATKKAAVTSGACNSCHSAARRLTAG